MRKFKISSSDSDRESMGWITVYIAGKSDFREDVRKRLDASNVNFMPGYSGSSTDVDMDIHDLYWLDETLDIRKFKEAIGSKLVWKYRLNFFTSLEAFVESQKNKKKESEFTPEENAFLLRMQEAEYH